MADPAGHSHAQASNQLEAFMVRSLQPMIPTEDSAASIASPAPANPRNNQPINPQSGAAIMSTPSEQQKMLLNCTRERFTAIARYPAMIGFVQQLVVSALLTVVYTLQQLISRPWTFNGYMF